MSADEIEQLRAAYEALDERAAIAVKVTGRRWSAVADELRAENESLRATVARVREVCTEESYNDACDELIIRTSDVLSALDGEDVAGLANHAVVHRAPDGDLHPDQRADCAHEICARNTT